MAINCEIHFDQLLGYEPSLVEESLPTSDLTPKRPGPPPDAVPVTLFGCIRNRFNSPDASCEFGSGCDCPK